MASLSKPIPDLFQVRLYVILKILGLLSCALAWARVSCLLSLPLFFWRVHQAFFFFQLALQLVDSVAETLYDLLKRSCPPAKGLLLRLE